MVKPKLVATLSTLGDVSEHVGIDCDYCHQCRVIDFGVTWGSWALPLVPPEHLLAAGRFERFSRVLGFQKGSGGGAP